MKQYIKIQRDLSNQNGATLVMVLMVLVVLSVLGLGLLGLAVNNTKLNMVERDQQAAFYIAEAGANYRLNQIETIINESYMNTTDEASFFESLNNQLMGEITYNDFEPTFGQQPSVSVTVSLEDGNYLLESEGKIGNRTRKLERPFNVNWIPKVETVIPILPPDIAIYTGTSISLNGNVTIEGNVGTISSRDAAVDIGNINFDGIIYVPPDSEAFEGNNVNKSGATFEPMEPANIPLPNFPQIPSYEDAGAVLNQSMLELNDNLTFSTITVNSPLEINVGNKDRTIVVDQLTVNNDITIKGNGNLTIFVKDDLSFQAGVKIAHNNHLPGGITMYYGAENSQLAFNNVKIFGSIYAKDADIVIDNDFDIHGALVTGGQFIDIDTNGNVNEYMIYAPNAKTTLTRGKSEVRGTIITKEFSAQGNHKVSHQPVDFNEIPFFTSNSSENSNNAEDLIEVEQLVEVGQ